MNIDEISAKNKPLEEEIAKLVESQDAHQMAVILQQLSGALILQRAVVKDGKWSFEDVRRLTSPHPQYTTGLHTFNICKGTVVVDIHGYRKHAWLSSLLTKTINSVRTRR